MIVISESIKGDIAERLVEQAHPGYSAEYQGEWYVVNGSRLMHYSRTAPWTPWSDGDAVISVEDLVNIFGGGDQENCDFWGDDAPEFTDAQNTAARVDFALNYVPDAYDEAVYAAQFGE